MGVYDPPLPREHPQCNICDAYLEQDYFGDYWCPVCEGDVCEEDTEGGDE